MRWNQSRWDDPLLVPPQRESGCVSWWYLLQNSEDRSRPAEPETGTRFWWPPALLPPLGGKLHLIINQFLSFLTRLRCWDWCWLPETTGAPTNCLPASSGSWRHFCRRCCRKRPTSLHSLPNATKKMRVWYILILFLLLFAKNEGY